MEENNIIEIEIPQEVRDQIQKAHLETESRRDILIYIMEHDDINVSKERLSEYEDEYEKKFFNFNQLKTQLEKNYVKPILGDNASFKWSLNYENCILTIQME